MTTRDRAPALLLVACALLALGGCGDPAFDDAASSADASTPSGEIDAFELPVGDATIVPRPDASMGLLAGRDPFRAETGFDTPFIEGPALYPADRLHSPITPWAADQLRAIAGRADRAADVFAKIGDSVTVSGHFMRCVAAGALDLGDQGYLWPTVHDFLYGEAGGTDPFSRQSLAATVGWSAWQPLAGAPSPLDAELAALDPRFAVVMFGTNDIQRRDIDAYAMHLWDLIDHLIDRGVIPLLSTIMPRDDDPTADAMVPRYNAIVRAIAQGRQVPLMNLHRALSALPDHGLGPDRLHPAPSPSGACDLTPGGLRYGYNARNLLTLTALDRARRAFLEPAPDPPDALGAAGRVDDPITIGRLPFVDLRDTRTAPRIALSRPRCPGAGPIAGPAFVYALELDRPAVVRARVFDRDPTDVDLHLLAAPEVGGCLDRADHTLEASLAAGTWYILAARAHADDGEFLLTVLAE